MDIEAFIDNTVLDERVSLSGCHAASTKRVPCGFDVTLYYEHQYTEQHITHRNV